MSEMTASGGILYSYTGTKDASGANTLMSHTSADFMRFPGSRPQRRNALPIAGVAFLRAHRRRQAEEKQSAGPDRQNDGHVFTRPDGHPTEPATLTHHFKSNLRMRPGRPPSQSHMRSFSDSLYSIWESYPISSPCLT
jgi:hypothetical protein